jgi:hypothetical protein
MTFIPEQLPSVLKGQVYLCALSCERRQASCWAAMFSAGLILVLAGLGALPKFLAGVEVALSQYVIPAIHVPVHVVIWSAIGSCSAVLYRVNRATALELEDPVRLMVTQPIVGIVMGTVSYLIVHLGLLTLTSNGATTGSALALDPTSSLRAIFFFSFISFLVGFSDRFADTLLKSPVGRLGGDKNAKLVNTQLTASPVNTLVLKAVAEALGKGERERMAQREDSMPSSPGPQEMPAECRSTKIRQSPTAKKRTQRQKLVSETQPLTNDQWPWRITWRRWRASYRGIMKMQASASRQGAPGQ